MKKLLLLSCVAAALWSPAQNPTLQWAKAAGGTGNDISNSIAIDASGNVYTTGYFHGTADFDPGAGTFTLTSAGLNDIFVLKLDASGNFIWAKNMGGTKNDAGFSISVDAAGNVYSTGIFRDTADFDPGVGVFSINSQGDNAFISKLDASGNLVYAKGFVGSGDAIGYAIALDASGNVYATGSFQNAMDCDPGPGTFMLTSSGWDDVFILKLNALGNFVWAKRMGDANFDIGHSLALDASGNVYTGGTFKGTVDFDPGAGISNLISAPNGDIFVSKLDSSGNFIWAKNMSGTGVEYCYGITLDASGNAYFTGCYTGTLDFDPGAGVFNLTSAGSYDIYISKLDASGNFVFAKSMGGSSSDQAFAITINAVGNIYTTGTYAGTADFDPGAGTYTLNSSGQSVFVSKLDASGNFAWAESLGGTQGVGYGVAVDASDNIHTAGSFGGTADFDPGAGIYNLVSAGNADIFIQKMSPSSLTGINELKNKEEKSIIYPNPNNGSFAMELNANSQIIISNSLGGIILDEKRNTGKQFFNFSDSINGIYFVKIITENKQQNFKMLIE